MDAAKLREILLEDLSEDKNIPKEEIEKNIKYEKTYEDSSIIASLQIIVKDCIYIYVYRYFCVITTGNIYKHKVTLDEDAIKAIKNL